MNTNKINKLFNACKDSNVYLFNTINRYKKSFPLLESIDINKFALATNEFDAAFKENDVLLIKHQRRAGLTHFLSFFMAIRTFLENDAKKEIICVTPTVKETCNLIDSFLRVIKNILDNKAVLGEIGDTFRVIKVNNSSINIYNELMLNFSYFLSSTKPVSYAVVDNNMIKNVDKIKSMLEYLINNNNTKIIIDRGEYGKEYDDVLNNMLRDFKCKEVNFKNI